MEDTPLVGQTDKCELFRPQQQFLILAIKDPIQTYSASAKTGGMTFEEVLATVNVHLDPDVRVEEDVQESDAAGIG